MNTSKKRADVGQWRRQRAWELSQAGWWQKDIAAALGVSRAAVCQWIKCAREGGGVEALRSRPHLGGPSKLTPRAAGADPSLIGSRGARVGLSRRRVDRPTHPCGDPAHPPPPPSPHPRQRTPPPARL